MTKWIHPEDFNPEEYTGFVYKITNLTNGKFYGHNTIKWVKRHNYVGF